VINPRTFAAFAAVYVRAGIPAVECATIVTGTLPRISFKRLTM